MISIVVTPGNPLLNTGNAASCGAAGLSNLVAAFAAPVPLVRRQVLSNALSLTESDALKAACTTAELSLTCALTALFYCDKYSFGDNCDEAFRIALQPTYYAAMHTYCDQQYILAKNGRNAECLLEKDRVGRLGQTQLETSNLLIKQIYPNVGGRFSRGDLEQSALYATMKY